MTKQLTHFAFIALAAVGCNDPVSASFPENDTDAASRIADAILDAQVEANGVPGMAAAFTRNGELVWSGGAGYRDLERKLPVEPSTSFRLASVSKLLTATAAMVLYDRKRLDLDAPVQHYLPNRRLAWASEINLRQLAAHTSGIPHYQDVDDARGGVHFGTVDQAVEVFANRPLLFAPGTGYQYSSYGYTLLSAAIEGGAGLPFLSFVSRTITHGLPLRPDLIPDPAHDTIAYEFDGDTVEAAAPHDYSYSWGGAGFRGTASGVAMFGARVMRKGFLSDEARTTMWTPSVMNDGTPVIEGADHIAFGWRIGTDSDGQRIAHHAGAAIGARSALMVYPESGDSVSVLSNAVWVSDIRETAAMLAAPFRTDPAGPRTPCPTWASRYTGTFGDKQVWGTARFAVSEGICRGMLGLGNAAGDWFDALPQGSADALAVISVLPGDRLDRGALVTPSGTYDFRRQADGSFAAVLAPTRKFVVQLQR